MGKRHNELEVKGVDFSGTLKASHVLALLAERVPARQASLIPGWDVARMAEAGFTLPYLRREVVDRLYYVDPGLLALDNRVEVRVERKGRKFKQTIKLPTDTHQVEGCLDRDEHANTVGSLRPDFREVTHEVAERLKAVFGRKALTEAENWRPAVLFTSQRTRLPYRLPDAPDVKVEISIDDPMVPRLFFGERPPITVVEFELKKAPKDMDRGELRALLRREGEWLQSRHEGLQLRASSNIEYMAGHIRDYVATDAGREAFASLSPDSDWHTKPLPPLPL